MALSRYRSRFFLVHATDHNLLEPGKRFHSSLNVVSWHSNRHSKKGPKVASFWLNCSRGNGDADDPNGVYYQLLHADPPMVRSTGRKRKEISADNGTTTIDCYELEVLVPEEGLVRQCYYCLSWEDGERRYSQIKYDKYWCPRVRVPSKSVQVNLTDRKQPSPVQEERASPVYYHPEGEVGNARWWGISPNRKRQHICVIFATFLASYNTNPSSYTLSNTHGTLCTSFFRSWIHAL